MVRVCPLSPNDSALARRIKASVALSPLRNLKALEKAASLPQGSLSMFVSAPQRQAPLRRRLVMGAVEAHLGLPVAEIATLAGIAPDGGPLAPVERTDDLLDVLLQRGNITARQADAARWFRGAAGGLSFPGLHPCKAMWKTPLRAAWSALERADVIIARQHRGCPPASFTVWRIAVENDRPGWMAPEPDLELARLERLALWTGLDALAAAAAP